MNKVTFLDINTSKIKLSVVLEKKAKKKRICNFIFHLYPKNVKNRS